MAKNEKNDSIDAQLQQLIAENARLKQEKEAAEAKLTSGPMINIKLSPKGGVSVYGLGRFPTTLYKEQWERLGQAMPDILQFIELNESKLKTKS